MCESVYVCLYICLQGCMRVCMYNLVARKVRYHVLVTFPMPHDGGCEIKIIVIVIVIAVS